MSIKLLVLFKNGLGANENEIRIFGGLYGFAVARGEKCVVVLQCDLNQE